MSDKIYGNTPHFKEMCEYFDIALEVVNRPEDQKGFVVEKKRWVVERTAPAARVCLVEKDEKISNRL